MNKYKVYYRPKKDNNYREAEIAAPSKKQAAQQVHEAFEDYGLPVKIVYIEEVEA